MSAPYRKKFTATIVAIVVTILTVPSVSADSGQDSPSSPPTPENTPSSITNAESNDSEKEIQDISIDILSAKKSHEGRFTSLVLRITNNGLDNIHMNVFDSDVYDYREAQPSGITLQTVKEARYHPVMDAEKYCLCSGYASRTPFVPTIQPNKSVDYWMLYRLPADTQEVTVEIPGFDPIEDVPVE